MILAHRLASGPDPAWFCTVLFGTSVEEWNQVSKWETGSGPVAFCQRPGPLIPAHQPASAPNVFGQTPTRLSRSDLSRFYTI